MQDDKFSFCMNSLSLVLKSKVLYVTNCRKIDVKDDEEEDKLVCLSTDSIIILCNGLESTERKIYYDKIVNVDVDLNDEKVLRIVVEKTEEKNNHHINLLICNREEFINNLQKYFEIYAIKESGKFKQLIINFICNSENKNEITTNVMRQSLPANHIISSYNNYLFYIKKGFIKLEDNLFFYSQTKSHRQSSKLILDITTEQPVEKLSTDDEYDIAYSSYKKYKNHMTNNFKFKKYSTLLSTSYIKASNMNRDICQWEGWRIKSRTGLDKNSLGRNIIFIFLRRKFIPPFCETYQDITLILLEEYSISDDDFAVSQKSVEIIENIANSITPKYIQINKDCTELIKMKMNKFLMDSSSYEYFINHLTIIGESAYKLGLDVTLKLILIIEEYSQDFGVKIKKRFLKKIELAHKLFRNKDYQAESYVKKIQKVEFSEIFRLNDEIFEYFFPKSSQKDFEIWDSKRWDFLVFCLKGGLSFNLINLETIISIYKRKEESTNLHWLINKMLNLRIINLQDEILLPNISSVISNFNQIKNFSFNEDVMACLIENNILAQVQGVDSEYVYTQFLNFLITKHSSNKIILSVYNYLKLINKKSKIKIQVKGIINEYSTEANENEYNLYESDSLSLKNKLKILLESFLKIYAQNNLCPIILSIACKCLNILANFNISNKISLLNSNCLGNISEYLNSPDEKLVYTSVQLLINLLMDTKENIKAILEKNSKILKRCLKIIKGQRVVGVYFSTKTLILVINLILILIKIPTAKVKEELCKVEYKSFAKYFLNYLLINQKTIDEDLAHPLALQEKVIDLLYLLINRNFDYRNYLQDNFKMVEILDQKFETFCHYSKILMKTGNKGKSSSNETFEEYIKFVFVLMKFLKRFISNDFKIMHKVRISGVNIINGITIIKENREKEFFRFLIEVTDDLYLVLYEEDKLNKLN